jgi:DNA-binding beta-propeller fold protein YncE
VGPHGSQPEGLAYDGTTVWVVDQAGDRVLPLDPATGRLGQPVPVGHEPRLATAGRDGVYVANYTEGSVTRVVDGRPTTRNAGSCLTPQGIAEAAGVVWVACTVDGQVVGLDPGTLAPVVALPGLAAADAVVADGDTVYVVGQAGPTVWTLDARSRKVTGELVLDDAAQTRENVDAAMVGRHLVVSHPEARRLYDVPLRLLGR